MSSKNKAKTIVKKAVCPGTEKFDADEELIDLPPGGG